LMELSICALCLRPTWELPRVEESVANAIPTVFSSEITNVMKIPMRRMACGSEIEDKRRPLPRTSNGAVEDWKLNVVIMDLRRLI